MFMPNGNGDMRYCHAVERDGMPNLVVTYDVINPHNQSDV
jgi:hypothetical protein